jgi:hypothetical protein
MKALWLALLFALPAFASASAPTPAAPDVGVIFVFIECDTPVAIEIIQGNRLAIRLPGAEGFTKLLADVETLAIVSDGSVVHVQLKPDSACKEGFQAPPEGDPRWRWSWNPRLEI